MPKLVVNFLTPSDLQDSRMCVCTKELVKGPFRHTDLSDVMSGRQISLSVWTGLKSSRSGYNNCSRTSHRP